MVTKQLAKLAVDAAGLILAKIHMVTKLQNIDTNSFISLILAKIHMVTKPSGYIGINSPCLILAKIHMVTKPPLYYLYTQKFSVFLFLFAKKFKKFYRA